MRNRLSALLGAAVSGTLLFLALRHVRLSEMLRALSSVNVAWIAPMVAATAVDLLIRALRWRLLLGRSNASVWSLFKLEAIGLGINNVLPMRVGELARAYLAGSEFGVSTLTSLATILIERVLDVIALLSLFACAGLLAPQTVPPTLVRSAIAIAATLALGLLGLAFAEGKFENARWPRLSKFVGQLIAGTRSLHSWSAIAQAALFSLALWLTDAAIYWIGGVALGLSKTLLYGRCLVLLTTVAATSILPAVPGSFGTFEAAVQRLMSSWGVDSATALAYAGFAHLVSYLTVTTLGIVFLFRAGHTLGGLARALRAENSPSS